MSETKITRDYFMAFLDLTQKAPAGTYNWARIDKSTVFSLEANPKTEDFAFINLPSDQTELTGYSPKMEQEIAIYRGNPMYDFISDLFYNMDVTKAVVPCLIVFPKAAEADDSCPAWLYDDAQVVLGTLDSVAGKITYSINFNGAKKLGTVVATDGAPVFTEAT